LEGVVTTGVAACPSEGSVIKMKSYIFMAAIFFVAVEVIHQMTNVDRLGIMVLLGIGFVWYASEN